MNVTYEGSVTQLETMSFYNTSLPSGLSAGIHDTFDPISRLFTTGVTV